jgi:ABC-type multidrug transport system fused ATPase/permease subunit
MLKKSRLFMNLWQLSIDQLFRYWPHYVLALGSLFLLHYSQSEIPFYAKKLGESLDLVQRGEFSYLPFILLALAIIIFRTASRLFFFYPARIQQRDLRDELIQFIELAHPKRYNNYSSGQMFQLLFNDFNRLRGLIGFGLLQVGNIIIAFFIFLPKITYFNSDLLLALSPFVVGVILFSATTIMLQPLSKKSADASGDVQNALIESFNAKKTVKNYHAEKSIIELFNKFSDKELSYVTKYNVLQTLSSPLIKLSFGASFLWGAYLIKNSPLASNGEGASALIFYSGFLYLILEPLMFLSWIGVVASAAYSGWTRLQGFARDLTQPQEAEGNIKTGGDNYICHFWGREIAIPRHMGNWLILSGETGCGKTTLLNEIADILNAEGKGLSMVHQEPYLYNATIAENIFLGSEMTSEREVLAIKLLKIFGLESLASHQENILAIEVGENGKKISGGQAKRLALIRSIFSQPEYLIWDDPFSSVDLIFEKEIISQLKTDPLTMHKKFILSSHRLSTVRNCDYLVLLEKHQGIIEQGLVKQLLVAGTISSEYFSKQVV